jgi:hypothetical protein
MLKLFLVVFLGLIMTTSTIAASNTLGTSKKVSTQNTVAHTNDALDNPFGNVGNISLGNAFMSSLKIRNLVR